MKDTKQGKIYKGDGKTQHVIVQVMNDGQTEREYTLPFYLEVVNHSPDGFHWGYNGSAPAQLAAAILMDLYGKSDWYMQFKFDVISRLEMDKDFTISEDLIRNYMKIWLKE